MPHLLSPGPCHKIRLAADGHMGPVALGHDLPSVTTDPGTSCPLIIAPTCGIRVPTDAEQARKA